MEDPDVSWSEMLEEERRCSDTREGRDLEAKGATWRFELSKLKRTNRSVVVYGIPINGT